MKVAVIGAGPAGLSAAYLLSKNNIKVDVYEASDSVGGMCRSIVLWDQIVDIGPHRFFSNDKKVNELWLEVIGEDYQMVNRLTRIYYKNKFFYYPLKLGNVLRNIGLVEAAMCVLSYMFQRLKKEDDVNSSFEAWVTNRFGKRLYNMFFKTYTEKLWGITCDKLDADFAAQRIKKLSLFEAVKNAFLSGKGNKHKTLVDQFAYPRLGTGQVYQKMSDYISAHGGKIHLKSPVYRIDTKVNQVKGLELINGDYIAYDHVISSMPYTAMVQRLPEAPEPIVKSSRKLTYRNTVIVYLKVNATDLFKDNWLYVHSPELKTGRITNFRNWVPTLYGTEEKTILALEYWCNADEDMWTARDEELIQMARSELEQTGLAKKDQIEDGYVHRINKCYPVYSRGYKQILKPIEECVTSVKGLSAIGRYGAFKYNNQDHSILMGIMAAENIMGQADHRLEDVNSDYESYQESYVVTNTGLVKQ